MTHVPWKLCANCGCASPQDATRCRHCDTWFPLPPLPGQGSRIASLVLIGAVVGGLGIWAVWSWGGDLDSALRRNEMRAAETRAPVPTIEITWTRSFSDFTLGYVRNVSPFSIGGLGITFGNPQIVMDRGFYQGTDDRRIAAQLTRRSIAPGECVSFTVLRNISVLPPPDMIVSYGPNSEHPNFNIRVIQSRETDQGIVPVE